jgi:hypothetical protein
MRRILAAALLTLGGAQIAAADVSGHAFVGGYMRGHVFATGTPVHIAAYERLIDLATGAVGPRACVAFVEYACAPIELRVHPTLLEATLSGIIPTDSGGSIEIDLTVETGTRITGTQIGVGDIRVPPAASVCNFVYPACAGSTLGGGVNYFTAALGIGILRHRDAAGNLTHELNPHLCDCDNLITYGQGTGAAVLAG